MPIYDSFHPAVLPRLILISIFLLGSSCKSDENIKFFQGQEGGSEQPPAPVPPVNPNPNPLPPVSVEPVITNPQPHPPKIGNVEIQVTADGNELTPDTIKRVLSENSDGNYYRFPGESQVCSRAPLSKTPDTRGPTPDYDRLNTKGFMPNPQSCMGDGKEGRKNKSCAGLVPYCCYMMAATGDYTKCIGYWERLWCTEAQCQEARAKGATDSQCGAVCTCGLTFKKDCGSSTPHVPLLKRLRDLGQIK